MILEYKYRDEYLEQVVTEEITDKEFYKVKLDENFISLIVIEQ